MSKKHFNALADAMKNTKPSKGEGTEYLIKYSQWKRDTQSIAEVCLQSNSRFDYHFFLSACGVE
jgi:hypothetical protein